MTDEISLALLFRSESYITPAEKTTLIWKNNFDVSFLDWSEHSVLPAQ